MATIQKLLTDIAAIQSAGRAALADKGVETSANATIYDLMQSIEDIPSGGGIHYSAVDYDAATNTYTLTEKDDPTITHTLTYTYDAQGRINGMVYDNKAIAVEYNNDGTVTVGGTVVDVKEFGVPTDAKFATIFNGNSDNDKAEVDYVLTASGTPTYVSEGGVACCSYMSTANLYKFDFSNVWLNEIKTSNDWTFSIWVKCPPHADTGSATERRRIFNFGLTNFLYTGVGATQNAFYGTTATGTAETFDDNKACDNNWHNIVFVKKGTLVRLTIDAESRLSIPNYVFQSNGFAGLFRASDWAVLYGYAHSLLYWNRALSMGEIQALFEDATYGVQNLTE